MKKFIIAFAVLTTVLLSGAGLKAATAGSAPAVQDISRPGEVHTATVVRNGEIHELKTPVKRVLDGNAEKVTVNFDDAIKRLPPVDPSKPQRPTAAQVQEMRSRADAGATPPRRP